MSSRWTRRTFLGLGAGGALLLGGGGLLRLALRPKEDPPSPPPTEPTYLPTLALVAVALVPADETPGAEPEWARGYLSRRAQERPEDTAHFGRAAARIEAESQRRHQKPLAQLSESEREELLRGLYPSLAADESLATEEREERRILRELMVAFFASDRLSVDDPVYRPERAELRDPAKPSGPEHGRAGSVTDAFMDRSFATWVGTGDYARAWLAAGYTLTTPGVCKPYEEYTRPP